MTLEPGLLTRPGKITFFKGCSGIIPHRPRDVEEQSIKSQIRVRPYHHDHEEIKRLANAQVGTADDELRRPNLLSAQLRADGR